MVHSLSDIEFTIVIPDGDSEDFDAITSTLVETASVLPNTRMTMEDGETRVVIVSEADAKRWPDLVEDMRQLTHEYEKLIEKRDD